MRILQVLGLIDAAHKPSDGRFAVELNLTSKAEGAALELTALELDAKMGELRLASPAQLTSGPLAAGLTVR